MLAQASTYHSRDADRKLRLQPKFEPKVALLKTTPGITADRVDALLDAGYRGIVLEGTGLGHAPQTLFPGIERAQKEGIPVVMTSQCLWGRVQMRVYRTGVQLVERGVIPAEDMLPETAYVKLMWVLAQTRDPAEVKARMRENLVGEISDVTKHSQYREMGSG
jgi:glutamyl-tRNA(Gln) amidotransferase subunit D